MDCTIYNIIFYYILCNLKYKKYFYFDNLKYKFQNNILVFLELLEVQEEKYGGAGRNTDPSPVKYGGAGPIIFNICVSPTQDSKLNFKV